jgi:hypothetical protein
MFPPFEVYPKTVGLGQGLALFPPAFSAGRMN